MASPPRDKQDKLKNIRSGFISRGLSLARLSASFGTTAVREAFKGVKNVAPEEFFSKVIEPNALKLVKELGRLKGSAMKVGQLLSTYGEHFFPPEVNEILKTLQSGSQAVEWPAMEKVVRKELPAERLAELEIDPEPMASASLGQVHLAVRKSDGQKIALKIQYAGVDKAIDRDLAALKSVFSVLSLVPAGERFDAIFDEVKAMLHHEMDFRNEARETKEFAELLRGDDRYVIPRVFEEYSGRRVIATEYQPGVRLDGPEVLALSQERRDAIAEMFFDLYLKELFVWRKVQTDPHFGNYQVQLAGGDGRDRLVLFDFGAVRKFPKKFLDPYYRMVAGAVDDDREELLRGAQGAGFVEADDSEDLKEGFVSLCRLIVEPFVEPPAPFMDADGKYCFGESDLPKRVVREGKRIALQFKLRPPPREVVFLDRKVGGVFVVLATLGARIRTREKLKGYLHGE